MRCPRCHKLMTKGATQWRCPACGQTVRRQTTHRTVSTGFDPISQTRPATTLRPITPTPALWRRLLQRRFIIPTAAGIAVIAMTASVLGLVARPAQHQAATPTAIARATPSTTPSSTTCGKVIVTDLAKSAFASCFNQYYQTCRPASIIVDTEAAVLKGTIVTYAIQGRAGSSCQVQWSYGAFPVNPTWANKTIICPYAPGPDFQAALAAKNDFSGCTGPLLATMGAGVSQ